MPQTANKKKPYTYPAVYSDGRNKCNFGISKLRQWNMLHMQGHTKKLKGARKLG